ncbi:hypothetical protein GE253_09530 [Niveispirillum sp. SYP-B3756]|uniref:calcium-binding protein n=1 Tax=Niveispirillum sp. SYP-B3756 TaxID=2662178 RepID=UPI001290E797|nr:hypothetical protein [Niveispirillum sp. SYP-B3756]MQP65585.1 hypothetical protein [Niveispirillum sp. SYP-B3756]
MDLSSKVDLPGIAGMVYDGKRDLIYFTTRTGTVERWSPTEQKFLSAVKLGGTLADLDITADGSYLLVAQSNTTAVTVSDVWWNDRYKDTIHRINLDTLKVQDLNFLVEGAERGVYDIAIAGSDTALVTTDFSGSGWNPLRWFDADANAFITQPVTTSQGGNVSIRHSSYLIPSENNRYTLILEADTSNAQMQLYDAQAGTIVSSGDLYAFNSSGFNNGSGDISEARGLAFNLGYVFDFKFSLAKNLGTQGYYSGEFSSTGNYLFAQRTSGEVVIMDTHSWMPVGIFAVDDTAEIKTGSLELMGKDGRYLVGQTATGFAVLDLSEKLKLDLAGNEQANFISGELAADTLSGGGGADTISGFGGDDQLFGDDGRDVLNGGGGDDILIGGTGGDALNGGAGIDVIRYDGPRSNYQIKVNGSQVIVTGPAGTGPDTLTGVELLQFDHQVVPVTPLKMLENGTLFDEAGYLGQYADVAAVVASGALGSGAEHYLRYGQYEGRSPFGLFNTSYYLEKNPDVAAAVKTGIIGAWQHFHQYGWREGRDPSALFDVSAYKQANPDVQAADMNPLFHYLANGMAEGRTTSVADLDYYGLY